MGRRQPEAAAAVDRGALDIAERPQDLIELLAVLVLEQGDVLVADLVLFDLTQFKNTFSNYCTCYFN